jgi:glycosyltransferase involved in cell wall biosynthesis
MYEAGVSVIIPCYNREAYLEECIRSVLNQEVDFPVEIIITDDGSQDSSIDIALNFKSSVTINDPQEYLSGIVRVESSSTSGFSDSSIFVLEKPADCKTQGAAPTRNRGVALARYSYIAFLDSDDIFLSGHLDRLFHFLEEHSEFGAAVDQLVGFDRNIENCWIMPYLNTDVVRLESFFLSPYFNPSVALVRHSVLDEIEGPFDETLRLAEDVDLFLHILEKYQMAILRGDGAGLREHTERSTAGSGSVEQYKYAWRAMEKAVRRYPYPPNLVRKRKASIAFRLAQGDIRNKHYFSAICRLLYAGLLDPVRAFSAVIQRKFD